MPDITPDDMQRPVRALAESYVAALAELDPLLATRLGTGSGQDRLPDLSPAGQQARDDLARTTLDPAGRPGPGGAPGPDGDGGRRPPGSGAAPGCCASGWKPSWTCAGAGEHLRAVSNIFGPLQRRPERLHHHAGRDRRRLGGHRPPDERRPAGPGRLPRVAGRGRAPGAARRAAPGPDGHRPDIGDWLAAGGRRGLVRGVQQRAPTCPPRCAPTWTTPRPRRPAPPPTCGTG